MNLMTWFQKNRFPLLLCAILIIVEATFAGLIWQAAPPQTRWLGDTCVNASDVAVYLSYLKQVANGALRLRDLYAVEPHVLRFDPFWSSLGLIARTGIDPLWLHEAARWLLTCLLVFAVYRAALSVTKSERDARLGAVLAFLGVNAGWLYTIWIYAFGTWQWNTETAADLSSEFSVAYILIGGAHSILSLTLLLTCLRLSWSAFDKLNFARLALASALAAILFSFHPYFSLLFAVYWPLVAFIHHKRLDTKRLFAAGAVLACSFLPALAIFLPLVADTIFRTHHLRDNVLGFAPPLSWVATLLPFGAAVIWRFRKGVKLDKREYWVVTWLTAALISLIFPVPWKRKMTEGWGIALAFLGLPCWLAVRDFALRQRPKVMTYLLSIVLLLAAGFDVFHLLTTQLAWITSPEKRIYFYRPADLFDAWRQINRDAKSDNLVVTDDFWANTWTPAYTARTVLLGHDHETPRYKEKIKLWKKLLIEGGPEQGLEYLADNRVTHLILTKPETRAKLAEALLGAGWKEVFRQGAITVWTAPGI